MKTALAIFALTFSVSSFAGQSITLTMKTHETLNLKKVSKTRFEKISDGATGKITLDFINGSTVKNLVTQEVNESDNTSELAYEVTGKNILKVEDAKEGISKEVKAEINKSFLGKVKGIKIDAQVMQELYAASMKKSGLAALKNLRVFGRTGVGLSSTLDMSDMECKTDGDLMVCEQDATLTMLIGNI